MKKTIVRAVSTAAVLSSVYAGSAYANTYTVQKGDTLSKIASKHQTSVSALMSLNGLTSDRIYANQTLKVAEASATVPAPPTTPVAPASEYIVVSGDYLGKIARQFGMSVAELKSLNGLTSDRIYVGDKLKVSGQTTVVTPPADNTVAPPPPVTDTSAEYVVVSGDYLGKIARQFGMTVAELKSLNGLTSDMIYVGNKLKVKGTTTVAPAPETPAPSTPAPAPSTPAPATTSEYTVVSGDYLAKIASQFGMSVADLKTLNGLSSDLIYVGQKLKVSGTAAPAPTAPTTPASTNLIDIAKSLIGIPYVWGGSTLNGFDCSGFIYYVANQSGYKIGRTSAEGYHSRSYYVDQPQPGDLVFFKNTYKQGISHVGFYLGNNQFIHATDNPGVTISNLGSSYWQQHFDSFKRFY